LTTLAVEHGATLRKVSRRLIPFLFLLYVAAYLDRINVGFAQLQMKSALGFSDAVYGLGAGIFFVGYFLFEVPSNLILARVGARVWIARIMITWGLISSAMAFVHTPESFYVLRFLLGVAEAGFFPGIIYYLGLWFPAEERASAVSKFMTATAIAGVIGGPLAAVLFKLEDVAELAGWQWIFIAEGLPSVLLGVIVLFPGLRNGRPLAWVLLMGTAFGLYEAAKAGQTLLLLFLPPILINGFMAWVFGNTLQEGRTPLIERAIILLHGPPEKDSTNVVAYARNLTLVWTVLFASLATVNLVLAALASPGGLLLSAGLSPPVTVPLGAWSFFPTV